MRQTWSVEPSYKMSNYNSIETLSMDSTVFVDTKRLSTKG